jgi:hypothetical protein
MNKTLKAHFDGEKIYLDEPADLKPNTRLMITILSEDDERENWHTVSLAAFEKAFGADEPDYAMNLIKSPNLDYGK